MGTSAHEQLTAIPHWLQTPQHASADEQGVGDYETGKADVGEKRGPGLHSSFTGLEVLQSPLRRGPRGAGQGRSGRAP